MLKFLLLAAAFLITNATEARVLVRVGAYDFPPYYNSEARNIQDASLLTLSMYRLNRLQDRYLFTIVPTTAPRRVTMFNDSKFDMMLFEDPNWGWQNTNFHFIALPIQDGELVVFPKEKGSPSVKDIDRKNLLIAGVQGFHYQLGSNKKNSFPFEKNHVAVYGPESVLRMVASSRVSMGLVPKSYFYMQKQKSDISIDKVFVQSRIDTEYDLGIILNKKAPISLAEMQRLTRMLIADSQFNRNLESLNIIKKGHQ